MGEPGGVVRQKSAFIVVILFFLHSDACTRTGFDRKAEVDFPPSRQRLSAVEQRFLDRAVERELQECRLRPEPPSVSWSEFIAYRAPRIAKHPQLSRYYSIMDRLFA